MLRKVPSLAQLVVLDGLRRYALIGLIVFAVALELAGFLFFDLIPRDIGRASSDFILSVGWLTGFLFLFFHCVQTMAWDEERLTIHTLLARPISRTQYVFGMFAGLAALLLLLNILLGIFGYGVLISIKSSVVTTYFEDLNVINYILAWLGLLFIEIINLAVIVLFSALIRGSFPVLLLSVSYYFICSGLPVVRDVFRADPDGKNFLQLILQGATLLFPDFNRLDFKGTVIQGGGVSLTAEYTADVILWASYVLIVLLISAFFYSKRDLQ